jgi:hypothetical protein
MSVASSYGTVVSGKEERKGEMCHKINIKIK